MSSLANFFLKKILPDQRLLQHIMNTSFSSQNFLERVYKGLYQTDIHFYQCDKHSTFTSTCLIPTLQANTGLRIIELRKGLCNLSSMILPTKFTILRANEPRFGVDS